MPHGNLSKNTTGIMFNSMRIKIAVLVIIIAVAVGFLAVKIGAKSQTALTNLPGKISEKGQAHELAIESLRAMAYPGSDITVEQTLTPGQSYNQYIASYESDGNKIYALLTIPTTDKPSGGYPAIVFNHGYIPPGQYSTTERYAAYVDAFARNGYVVFKSDYRGHGESEGEARGAYGSVDYTKDVLNALASVKKLKDVNTEKIGMWGHSLGGYITLRAMVVDPSIKAGVIWAGVVGSYEDLLYNWRRSPPPGIPSGATSWRSRLIEQYGDPSKNPQFWNSISATSYLSDISGPLQLHHGTADESVPSDFSKKLEQRMTSVGKQVQYFEYEGDDHNLSTSFSTAAQRSVDFFNKILKD